MKEAWRWIAQQEAIQSSMVMNSTTSVGVEWADRFGYPKEWAVCDVEAPRLSIIKTTNPVDLWCDMHYLVFSGEDMLLVSSFLLKEYLFCTDWFLILNMKWNDLNWEEIQTLGNKMLFVGCKSSVSFSAADFAGSPSNRIYFINDVYRNHDFGIFSVSNEIIELLVRYKLNSVRGFRGPIWVTPNPRWYQFICRVS